MLQVKSMIMWSHKIYLMTGKGKIDGTATSTNNREVEDSSGLEATGGSIVC